MKTERGLSADQWVRNYWNEGLERTVGEFVRKHHINPDYLTIAGGVFGVGAGALTYYGRPQAGLVSLGGSYFLDAIDGWVARKNGGGTPNGEFLDSVWDRYVDWSVLTGISKYAHDQEWEYPYAYANMLLETSPKVSFGRLAAESYTKQGITVEVPKLDLGSRLTRSIALATCLGYPDKRVWTGALGASAVGAGFTSQERMFASLNERERIVAAGLMDPVALFKGQDEACRAWGDMGEMLGFNRHAAGGLGLVTYYLAHKYDLVNGHK